MAAAPSLDGNVTSARRSWFVDAPRADMHLTSDGRAAIDAGVAIPDVSDDFDRAARPSGRAPDAGAFEASVLRGGRAAGPRK